MKYAVVTFGCRVNQADSLGFEDELLAAGAVPVSPDAADLVVVNTCSVTGTSDQCARQTIRRVARDNPGARIVVTGCYATSRPEEVGGLPNVFRVVPNDDKPRLVPLIRSVPRSRDASAFAEASTGPRSLCGRQSADRGHLGDRLDRPDAVRPRVGPTNGRDVDTRVTAGDEPCGAAIEPGVAGRTAFTLRVQIGCAESCSYCIIPATRGTPRSVPVGDVLREVDRLAVAGFKEVALTGVHLGSYGRDLMPPSSLVELLRALDDRCAAESDLLFRISSLEPMDCSRDIVDLLATSERFAPHVHLPLQHASDRVLAAMRRPYTSAYFASLVDGILERIPHASIGSDIIVGFPGETDEDFDQLTTYLERSSLTHLHVFPYSDRPGTVASTMGGKVDGRVIRARGRRVREIGAGLTDGFRALQIGTSHRALTIEDGTLAVTGNFLKVRIPPGRARNEWVRIRITSQHDGELLGC